MILRNSSDDTRWLPDLGVSVEPGATFEATGDLAESYLGQPWCSRVDTPARKAAAKRRRKQPEPTPEPQPTPDPAPAGEPQE